MLPEKHPTYEKIVISDIKPPPKAFPSSPCLTRQGRQIGKGEQPSFSDISGDGSAVRDFKIAEAKKYKAADANAIETCKAQNKTAT